MLREITEWEEEYQEMIALSKELRIPLALGYWNLETSKKDKLINKRRFTSHSFNRNAYNMLVTGTMSIHLDGGNTYFQDGYLNMKNTSGTLLYSNLCVGNKGAFTTRPVETVTTDTSYNGYLGGKAVTTRGIVVGTSDDAEDFDDYRLTSRISHGNGSNLLSYVGMQVSVKDYDTPTKTHTTTYQRYFNNNSGASIYIGEVSMYGCVADIGNHFMLFRDVISPKEELVDTAQLKVEYTFQMTHPS